MSLWQCSVITLARQELLFCQSETTQSAVAPGMKGMGQVAAGSTRLIQQGNILVSEMESLPKRNLLPRCLPAASA